MLQPNSTNYQSVKNAKIERVLLLQETRKIPLSLNRNNKYPQFSNS